MRTEWLLMSLVMAVTPVWAGEVYKWVDEQGRVHYGDKPQGSRAESVDVPSGKGTPPPATDREETRQRLLRAYEEERLERQQQREEAQKEAELRQRNCAIARDDLRNLQGAAYLYDLDENGNRVILNDAEHAQALADARAAVKKWCGP